MPRTFRVLITGHQVDLLQKIAEALAPLRELKLDISLLPHHETDPLGKPGPLPDLLVHCLSAQAELELGALIVRPPAQRPAALLVVGLPKDSDLQHIRLAMQAGARDFITQPLAAEELRQVVHKIQDELTSESGSGGHALTAFLSPKGGGGASTVAMGVAHMLVARYHVPSLLMDLDCQFGSQYLNLDLKPEKGLREALDAVDAIDEVALKAYVAAHPSGLHVMGALPSQILLPGDVTERQLYQLLEILIRNYGQIVVDLPCVIDSTFSLIIEKMRRIVLVVQQDFQNIRNGQKLVRILREDLQVTPDRIALVVNRFEANNPISLQDIENALQLRIVGIVPSDFRSVNDAANLGIPLLEHAPKSPVTQALLQLTGWMMGIKPAEETPPTFSGKLRAWLAGKG